MLKHVTADKSEYYASSTDGTIVSTGRLSPGNHVWGAAANNVIGLENHNEYLAAINAIGQVPDTLPPMGTELEADVVYAWNGQNVIVRQAHTRTEHDPDTVPALFLTYRVGGDDLVWIPNESIMKGDKRFWDDVKYEGISNFVSVEGQTPNLVPALWLLFREDWADWVQPLGAHDVYRLENKVTHNDQRWISTNDANSWEPGEYGWDEVI